MNEEIIIEIGSHDFPGFYNSIFCHPDEFIDYESELKDELQTLTNKEIEVEYDYVDFNEYKKDVSKAFLEIYIDKILETLPYNILDNANFKFEPIDGSCTMFSPQYYNYETDKAWCKVKTNYISLQLIKEYTLSLKGVKTYLKERFTSYDGFISFINNDFEYWTNLDIKEYPENMIIALFDMLLYLDNIQGEYEDELENYIPKELKSLSIDEVFTSKALTILKRKALLKVIDKNNQIKEIGYDVACDISQICYAYATIECNGVKYTEDEFRKQFKGDE